MAHVMDIVVIHEVMQSWSDEGGVCLRGFIESKSRWHQSRKETGNTGWTYLAETDGGGLFTETLAAEVETVFADETSLVGAQTAEEGHIRRLSGRYQSSHHWREPFPYFRGRENQTASCVMVR